MRKGSNVRMLFLAAVLLLVSVFAINCGGGGSSSGSSDNGGTTTTDSRQSAAASAQAASSSLNTNQLFENVRLMGTGSVGGQSISAKFRVDTDKQDPALSIANKVMANAVKHNPAKGIKINAAETYSFECTGGGSMTLTSDATGNNMSITFNQCREETSLMNGTMTVSGGETSGTISMTNFTMTEYDQVYTSTAVYRTTFPSLTMTYSSSNATTFITTITGSMSVQDFLAGISYNVSFNNLRMTDSSNAAGTQFTSTINGGMTESWSDAGVNYSYTITYTNYTMNVTDNGSYMTMSLSGSVSVSFTPSSYCGGGSWTISTPTALHVDYDGNITSGVIQVVSGSVTTVITFNANGSVTVTANGQTYSYADADALYDVCEIPTF